MSRIEAADRAKLTLDTHALSPRVVAQPALIDTGMEICFVNLPIEYYSPVSGGAIATIIMQTASELIALGHAVTVLTPANGDEQYAAGRVMQLDTRSRNDLSFLARRWSGIKNRLAGWDWPYYDYYLRSVLSSLRALPRRPDAVIVFNDLVTQKYIRAALPDTRVYSWLQNEWRTRQRDLAPTVSATDRFLTCSAYIRDWTAQAHGIPAEKFAVVASGVDLARFTARPDFLVPRSRVRVLFIGRIDPNKGPDLVADAVRVLRTEGLPIDLTVAGGVWFYGRAGETGDPYFLAVREKVAAAGGCCLGHVPRQAVPELVRDHDIVFIPSRSNEPFGLVALEAMASGCAVLASDRGGLPEACGGAAMLIDPEKCADAMARLRELAGDPGVLAQYKQRSVERAARASWSTCAAELERVIGFGRISCEGGAA